MTGFALYLLYNLLEPLEYSKCLDCLFIILRGLEYLNGLGFGSRLFIMYHILP